MAKYTLKHEPRVAQESASRIHSRFRPPQAPSWVNRLGWRVRRLLVGVSIICVVLVALLAVPFHRWDNESEMTSIHDALIGLQANPGSRDALMALHNAIRHRGAAQDWTARERPGESWHQVLQRQNYNVYFGASETLGLGLIQAGFPEKGLAVIKGLYNQNDVASMPKFSDLLCSACKNGYREEKCPTCRGTGEIDLPDSQKKFPLTAKLRNTRNSLKNLPDNELSPQYTCNSCSGTGMVKIPCSVCSGRYYQLLPDRVQSLFSNTLQTTLGATQRNKLLLRFMRTASSVQRKVLNKGQETLNRSGCHGDQSRAFSFLFPLDSDSGDESAGTPLSVMKHPTGMSAQPNGEDSFIRALRNVCEEKVKSGAETPDFQRMLAEAAKSHSDPTIQCCAMSVFGLGQLLKRETNQYSRVAEIQKSKFAGSPFLLFVTESDYLVDCPACQGRGEKGMPCPMCTGPKTCTVCRGAGWVKAGDSKIPCNACRNRAFCAKCKGTAKIMAVCPECLGHRKRLQLAGVVTDAYMASLSNLIAQCSARLAVVRERQAADVPLKEIVSARVNSVEKPYASSTNEPPVAVNENAEPATGSRKRKTDLPPLYVLGSALLLAGAAATVFRAKRKTKSGFSRLPGMGSVDASRFTDPLSLTAQDSQARVKRKTARIPFEEVGMEDAETRADCD